MFNHFRNFFEISITEPPNSVNYIMLLIKIIERLLINCSIIYIYIYIEIWNSKSFWRWCYTITHALRRVEFETLSSWHRCWLGAGDSFTFPPFPQWFLSFLFSPTNQMNLSFFLSSFFCKSESNPFNHSPH
jgi:hypothetical protein